MDALRPFLLEWVDSGMRHEQIGAESAAECEPIECATVGWLVGDHEDRVVLAMDSFPGEGPSGEVRQILCVPRFAVKRLVPLQEP